MDKEHFLIELKLHLRQLPLSELQLVMNKYEQLFDEKSEQGLSEYETTKSLPHPKDIAKETLEELGIEFNEPTNFSHEWTEFSTESSSTHPYFNQSFNSRNHDSGFVRFFQLVGIISLNIFFMIWLIFTWILLLFSGWLVTLSFIASPLLGLFSVLNIVSSYSLFQLFISLILCGVGLIGYLIMVPLSKVSWKLLKIYLSWNGHVLKGDRRL